MNLGNLGLIVALNSAGVLTPGPDLFLTLRLAARSRKHAFCGVLGISTALLLWATLSVSGAAALLSRHPWVLNYIQLFGAVWLLYMAFGLFKSVRERYLNQTGPAQVDVEKVIGSPSAAFRQGVATNLSNPKAVLYFTAILAPLLPVGAPWWVGVVYVITICLSAFVIFGLVAFFVSTERVRAKLLSVTHLIDFGAAILFTIFAIALLFKGISGLLG